MKKTALILAISLGLFMQNEAAMEGSRFQQSTEAVSNATYGHIDAKGLYALLASETPLQLLDARGNKWNDGTKIPGAILASYEYSVEELEAMVPHAETLIVVYCYSFTCPLSERLIDKLVQMGYQNVIEYPGGLKEWRDLANYPVESIE